MLQRSKRHPSIEPHHPAETISEDVLPGLGMSKLAFAKALGVSRQTLHDLLTQKQGVSAQMAVRLEAVIGGSAEMWLNLQAAHDLWHARRKVDTSKLKRLRAVDAVDEGETTAS